MSAETCVIGDATLYLGDCLEVLPGLPSIDLVITDPPYGTGGWRRGESGAGRNPAAKLIRESWDAGSLQWLRLCRGAPVLSFWPPAHMPAFMTEAVDCGYDKVRMLYMRKLDPKPQVGGRVAWSVEPIVALSKQGFQLFGGTDWLEASTPRLNRDADATGHPYQKPLRVMDWLLAKVPALPVVDPFMGSCTTGVAAIAAGRKFIGVEADPAYFEMACRRIEGAQRQAALFQKPEQHQTDLLSESA